jgi:branched-chain amino acid transport system permease protein
VTLGIAAIVMVAVLGGALERFHVYSISVIAIYGVAATGLALFMRYTGQLSIGHAAFIGLGAYAAARLTKQGVDFAIALAVAGGTCLLIGLVIGIITLRLRGFYLVVTTLAMGLISIQVFRNWDGFTEGVTGMGVIPAPTVMGLSLDDPRHYAAFAVAMLAATIAIVYAITRSSAGRALRGIADNELAAISVGIRTHTLKSAVFALSAMFAGISGALYAHLTRYIAPDHFGFGLSVELLVMAILGGMGRVSGGVLGAALIHLLAEELRFAPRWQPIFFGTLLIVICIYMPDGVSGPVSRAASRLRLWGRGMLARSRAA